MTSTPESDSFARQRCAHLLRGHAALALTAAEQRELRHRAAADPAQQREVAEFDQLHDWFAQERALFASAMAPVEPVEEADEGFARLALATARAEQELRSRLLHPAVARGGEVAPVASPSARGSSRVRRTRLLWFGLTFAAAAVLLLAAELGFFTAPPALQPQAPRDERAGNVVASIMLAPRVSSSDRLLSWSPVWHAQTYDVVVLDDDGKVVLQRPAEQARSTRWELTPDQIEQLRQRPELRLRVQALDGSGLLVGSTGDLPLRVD